MLVEVYSKTKDLPCGSLGWQEGGCSHASTWSGDGAWADSHVPNSASLKAYNEDSHASCWGYVGEMVCVPCLSIAIGLYNHLE